MRAAAAPWTHFWRVRKYLPERYGQTCRVLARGRMNSCLVEFAADGCRVVTSRWFARRLAPASRAAGGRE